MWTRRHFVTGVAASTLGYGFSATGLAAAGMASLKAELARIEARCGGRLGVAVLDTGSQARADHRADERFPMCSTFKLLTAAAVLKRCEENKERLDRRIRFEPGDIVVFSAVTKGRAGGNGMTIAELCEAAMTFSDNTAGNLLLASLGGPQALTSYARSIGDTTTRLDRIEPELNEAVPGDLRDTTTPAAMRKNLQTLVLGDALSAASKDQLVKWLIGNRTGDARLRAGLPADWRCGDKTGSGERGTTNDVGVLWPPGRSPVIVSIYLTGTAITGDMRNAVLADVGRATAAALTG
jgi:beta-lactamase class A